MHVTLSIIFELMDDSQLHYWDVHLKNNLLLVHSCMLIEVLQTFINNFTYMITVIVYLFLSLICIRIAYFLVCILIQMELNCQQVFLWYCIMYIKVQFKEHAKLFYWGFCGLGNNILISNLFYFVIVALFTSHWKMT